MNYPSIFRDNNDLWNADPFTWTRDTFAPSCDVEESETHFLLAMDMPGLKKDDIKVELTGNRLSISAERKDESKATKKNGNRSERFYGSIERSFVLPEDTKAQELVTEYKDGVLRIAVPKAKAITAQKIAIGEHKPGFFENLFKKDMKEIDDRVA